MSTFDKLLLFSGALLVSPVAFVIVVALGVALTLAVALFIVVALIVAPFVAQTQIAKDAGVRVGNGRTETGDRSEDGL